MRDTAETVANTETVSVFAPAKVNLALHVTGRREDGYHTLETLAVFVSAGDRLTASLATADRYEIVGPNSGSLPTHNDNLELKARDLLRAEFGTPNCPPVAIRLEKHLPVAAGVGGGSADAAATLLALCRLWELPLTTNSPELIRLALSLGADVPMCLASSTLVASGVGEGLKLIDNWPTLAMVLVNTGEKVATAAVFSELEDHHNPSLAALPTTPDLETLVSFLRSTRNDLQPPAMAIAPSISDALTALDQERPLFMRMTGSGATCFGIFRSLSDANNAAKSIRGRQPGWYVEAVHTVESREEAT
ncbi:4-(cytidine 5'-diphospho)-2-C-methyl-D-erythritol kinase [Notoacmeibacter sp. MSK16QG-6]|uniref:4-(cytidine 5'-diphospho)-2-C-methyl-D-erythritol kinase n=1 Tax=Notoacmeibacter sp. MSK16QG-6 TaxID=2957982 RepID=UPI00209F5ED4|nr:4-(cytidine 5'-diphospho)-2-C-methyl-D-erythritol kinase [Notoacmeibacter sp. MSK16QG-6]MCP1198260.1 4-(cytidine 5'-diphospho)-2-C-methyl-D-erythritol kinase [Notoacmeibacter sp. MSK16QG-6]